MLQENVCKTCEFWVRMKGEMGECHRYAPQVYSTQLESKRMIEHPQTYEMCWCGDWEKKTDLTILHGVN